MAAAKARVAWEDVQVLSPASSSDVSTQMFPLLSAVFSSLFASCGLKGHASRAQAADRSAALASMQFPPDLARRLRPKEKAKLFVSGSSFGSGSFRRSRISRGVSVGDEGWHDQMEATKDKEKQRPWWNLSKLLDFYRSSQPCLSLAVL